MTISKYEAQYHIRTYECDRNGNLRLLTLMNIFQDMADNHAQALGFGMDFVLENGFAWVGSNYVLEIERLPKIHENILVKTWPAEEKRVSAIRDFEVFDETGACIIRASSQWILIDFARKRPISLKDNISHYQFLPERSLETDFPKLPEVSEENQSKHFEVRFDDIDINAHVNNAVYLLWACEAIDANWRMDHLPKHIEIAFKKEGLMGENVTVFTDQSGDTTNHSIKVCGSGNDRELARVTINWRK